MARLVTLAVVAALFAVDGTPANTIDRRALEDSHHSHHDSHADDGEDGGHGHDDEEDLPWEWAGVFDTSSDGSKYTWTAQKIESSDGAFAYLEEKMDMVVLPAPDATEEALRALQEEAAHSFEEACAEADPGATITPAADACHELHMDTNAIESSFYIDASGPVAIFTQHSPMDFYYQRPDNKGIYYMRDNKGMNVKPVAELPEKSHHSSSSSSSTPWGVSIGASFVVLVCTLVGVVFVAPQVALLREKNPAPLSIGTNAFAAGALLATAFYLMMFEATHLIVYEDESEAAGMWGTMILLGILAAPICDLAIQMIREFILGRADDDALGAKNAAADGAIEDKTENGHAPKGDAVRVASPAKRTRVLVGILLAEFMHNLCDGIVIGAAFKGCSNTIGWTITTATVYHELAQEISDYLVLIDPSQGNLKPLMALLLNFLSGTSVIFGVIIVLASDVDMRAKGMLLAFGGGVYIYIAAVECMPRVYELAKDTKLRLLALFLFCLGCVGIGLVLLDHEHCVPDSDKDGGSSGGHDGHAH